MPLHANDLSPALAKRLGVTVKKLPKYRAEPQWADGVRFDSKRELTRYHQLLLLVKAKQIENVQVHPVFPITVNGEAICRYEADFRYFDLQTQAWIVEDAKGVRTPVYRLKKRLMKAVHGIDIQEV